MMQGRSWLPDDTRVPPDLDQQIRDCIGSWSGQWFVGAAPPVAPLRRRVMTKGFAWRSLACGMMLGILTVTPVGARVMGVVDRDRAEDDRHLLDALAEECLGDLRRRLAQVAEVKGDEDWHMVTVPGRHVAIVGDDSAPLLAVALSDPLFATRVRQALPTIAPPSLGSGRQALALTPAIVSAVVGRSAITVAELKALATGDVVILDRPLDHPLPFTINGVPVARGACSIVETAGSISLTITDPIA